MTDTKELLKKQAAWQESRKNLSWEEKVRMAERVREDVAKWRGGGRKLGPAHVESKQAPEK